MFKREERLIPPRRPNNVFQLTAFGARDQSDFTAVLCGAPRRQLNTGRSAASRSIEVVQLTIDTHPSVTYNGPHLLIGMRWRFGPVSITNQSTLQSFGPFARPQGVEVV